MKTPFFRVAVSGNTVDGRKITREQITQMAASFNPAKYGARIWMEHYRALYPDGPFAALGDVVALKAEENGDGELALFAQIEALPALVKMNKDRQKIYWSIEIDPNFQNTGQAYFVGLACTDTPASTFTEALKFSLGSAEFKQPAKTHLFSTYLEGGKLEEVSVDSTITDKIKALFSSARGNDARVTQIETAIEQVAGEVVKLSQQITALGADKGAVSAADLKKVTDQLATLTEAFNKNSPTDQRNKSGGGGSADTATDC